MKLQGRGKFPTGGIARERLYIDTIADSVKFRGRQ